MVRPYDLFIRFLVTKNYSELGDVNNFLEELSLPVLKREEFDLVFNQVMELVPNSVENCIQKKIYNSEFIKWMKVLEVYDLWAIEKQFRTPENAKLQLVYDINYDPELRTCLKALLVKKIKHEDICQDLNFKFSYMLRPEHIDLYERFFWCPARMSRRAWKSFLGVCSDSDKAILFLALTEAPEVLKTHLNLPSKVDVLPVYHKAFVQCSQKMEYYFRSNTLESNREARQWVSTLLDLGDKIKKYEATSVTDFGKALQMEFDFISADFPTPDETVLKELSEKKPDAT